MSYRTVEGRFEFVDEPVKGSRFIGVVVPAAREPEALTALDQVRTQWPDASHHTWAFRLRDGRHRSSDDGEPGGSAGRPILAQIEGHDVVDVMVIVVRWFGGTKLGVGGLIRAYGGCAGRALDRAPVVEVVPQVALTVTHTYEDTGAVQAVVGARGLDVLDTAYDVRVTVVLRVPEPSAAAVAEDLRNRTSGRATIEVS